jgi:phosphoenolpyruvate-protein kinase (PTS system EI component)
MAGRRLPGLPASPGAACGRARRAVFAAAPVQGDQLALAREALARAGEELSAVAARLRAEGRAAEADIVETGVLMAMDPALDAALSAAVEGGAPAGKALEIACGAHAGALAALGDEVLAARADDVRSLGRRAGSLLGGAARRAPAAGGPLVLVADDLGPADVAELDAGIVAVALAAGGPSAHAAVIARGLGIPMVVGVGPALLDVVDGASLLVDGDAGVVAPRRREAAAPVGPARTRDGRRVRVLANAAGPAEVRAALAAGAEGVGLLRTELAFLDAGAWPDEDAHRRALEPVLALLGGRTATVRVLDFGADKTPPFLRGSAERGLALLLAERAALAAQLRAIGAAARDADLRVLLPMVRGAAEVNAVRELTRAPLGAMLETVAAVDAADEIAAVADFLSIGTNDLVADVFGSDRFAPGATAAHDPRVLERIARAGAAAQAHGRVLEVCGEAASDPRMIPLLVGLGVTELSVGAARVRETHACVGALDSAASEALARRAVAAGSAVEVERLLAEAGHAAGERGDGAGGVLAVGAEP